MSVCLEVGKQYVSSSNKIVKIIETASSTLYKGQVIYLGDDGFHYTSSGGRCIGSLGFTDSFFVPEALIKDFPLRDHMKNVYPGSVTIKVEDPSSTKDKLRLKVGGSYKTNSGNKVTIQDRFWHKNHSYYIASDGRLYSEDGQRYLSAVSSDIYQNDPIISEWVKVEDLTWEIQKISLENSLTLEVNKSYHSESGKLIKIIDGGKDYFFGDDNRLYTVHGKGVPCYKQGEGIVHTENLEMEYGSPPPIKDPIEYLNSLPSFTEVILNLRQSLQNSGHCGETTSEKIGRQCWNKTVEEVCDRLLNKS